jgi:hypothetical protein
MQINKVDKLVPTDYNEVRAAYIKVVLRKWENVGDGANTRRKGRYGRIRHGYDDR